jgi:hypothetical protein
MMKLDVDRVRANVAKASTTDLLDRVTVYRAGMEPAAIALIEEELAQRGVSEAEVQSHEARRSEALRSRDGWAYRCCRCQAPAVVRRWGWLRLWSFLPILPWHYRYCQDHAPFRGD